MFYLIYASALAICPCLSLSRIFSKAKLNFFDTEFTMKSLSHNALHLLLWLGVLPAVLVGCQANTATNTPVNDTVKITLGAYTTPREAYSELLPLFAQQWQTQTGQTVEFEESYLGSGAQSRAIVEGFAADVAALSLEGDITRIVKAGLITHDWQATPTKGIVSNSVVALAVRAGNPKGILGWADLAKPGIEILTPNPKTSGGAMWNILALYGSALRGQVAGVPKNDPTAAQAFLLKVLKNVKVFDKGARESITNFEAGVGDVAITYENEVLVGQQSGQDYELIIPTATILIENPIALVDSSVDKHANRAVVEAFLAFLQTKEAQTVFAAHGLRSVNPDVAQATQAQYPDIADLFTVEYFGGWDKVLVDIFGDNGIFTKLSAAVIP
jgi:sulfate/thiosulfate-binding protein